MQMLRKIRDWAKKLKLQLVIIYLVSKDDRTPWYAKWLIYLTLAYALSPIDLIPDFIPVIGFLDDLILLPIGIYLVIKLIPKEVMAEARLNAQDYQWNKKRSLVGGTVVVLIWLGLALFLFLKFFKKPN